MKADLTRNTFDPTQHFARVLMQQGRVQLDADWNEQASILLHYVRTLAADLIGPQGGPAGPNCGFAITPLSAAANDFRIGLGRYYVDGILCEADSEPVGFVVQPNNANQIRVDQWTLDGMPFQKNQWLEVFDDVQLPGAQPAFQSHCSANLGGRQVDADAPGRTRIQYAECTQSASRHHLSHAAGLSPA